MSLLDNLVVATLPLVPKPLVRHFADPYIAGETLQHAVDTARKLNNQGMRVTMDVLGESVRMKQQSRRAVAMYLKVLEAIKTENLNANISIKPTQFGLGLDPQFCRDNFHKILEKLKEQDNFVRVDMEDSPYTTLTFDLVDDLKAEYHKVGVVIQAYLRRTMDDLEKRLIPNKTNIRLCKGIYIEPEEIAYKDFDIVRKNYLMLLEKALDNGLYVGIATHDEMLIFESHRIIDKLGIKDDQYEFQMLLGVTQHLRRQIVKDGKPMRVYVPFGKDWYAYSTRRLKENPKVAGYVFKDIFKL